ncbi:sugar transferase [Calidifontibacter sp. DB0510]|uniref:Sugar transferase n=1 Tax=Metallococcus carri TaxID=1656884 RepID=A0A967B7X6_9MICO|nr:sugar transferase [Metallococcus carri]NHN56411.1 sugar transferase [Metallococcus carri]NOP36035.1 sugar transferase [Calidifontibacter sp. DB2511S]
MIIDQRPTASSRAVSVTTSRWERILVPRLIAGDLACVVIASFSAAYVRFGNLGDTKAAAAVVAPNYGLLAAVLSFAWLLALLGMQSYRPEVLGVGGEEYRRVVRATFAAFGAFAVGCVIVRISIARGFLLMALGLGLALLLLHRNVMRVYLYRRRVRGQFMDRVLLIGSASEVDDVAEIIAERPEVGYQVAAVATGEPDPAYVLPNGTRVPQLGPLATVLAHTTGRRIDAVIVAGHSRIPRSAMRQLAWDMERTPMRLVLASTITDIAGPRIHWRPVEGMPLMSVEVPRYTGPKYAAKRGFDIVTAATLLLMLTPVLLLTALAIRLQDGGPVFFRQTRVGLDGVPFRMTKFRSMVVDAEARLADLQARNGAANETLFKLKDDPRVTRVGRFIRTYSIDELPQLFEVLRGTMSLVGPRPSLPHEVERYEDHVQRRFNVKPGMTGPWQVGGRSHLGQVESVRKDLYYVENWSLSGDLLIMIKTVRAVLSRDGAY